MKIVLIIIALLTFFSIIFWPLSSHQADLIYQSDNIWDSSEQLWSNLSGSPESITNQNAEYSENFPILMYHYVRDPKLLKDDGVGKNLSVAPAQLERQIKQIKQAGFETAKLSDVFVKKIYKQSVILTFDDGYDDFYESALPILKKYKAKATVFVITNRIDQPGYLSANQIQSLPKDLVEVGSHTQSHPNLANTSQPNIIKQLKDSKEKLESLVTQNIYSLSYPSGKYNDDVIQIAKSLGYQAAVTTESRIASIYIDNYLSLPRLRVKNNTDITELLKDYNTFSAASDNL